jgi:Protein of unknown function (DUF1499)
MAYGVTFIFAMGVLALVAYVRLATDDPYRWNVPIADSAAPTPGPCADQVRVVPMGARATCLLATTPLATLAALDAIALTTARTTGLAGTPDSGRITWVNRSRLMRYPDYITAEATQTLRGTRLDIFSRQRYGRADGGVNAARLKDWLDRLDQPS